MSAASPSPEKALRRLTLLSRSSALAVLQADLVARALAARWPGLEIARATRTSEGDRDANIALWTAADKGLFTADLSQALVDGRADLVVHSWKDLPIESVPGTRVAATLPRADQRDVLLIRADVAAARRDVLRVLSSSPRRAWQLETSLRPLLPWAVSRIETQPVRGNVPTRLTKLLAGDGDALVVAKAALDRLLSGASTPPVRAAVRDALDRCRWMVLPLSHHPTAPAQGALAIEIAANREDVFASVLAINDDATWSAVEEERAILASMGGGCHDAIGASVLVRDYGRVVSVRARMEGVPDRATWTLASPSPPPPLTEAAYIWPRPSERDLATRRPLDVRAPEGRPDLWVARADAWPDRWPIDRAGLVWTAGIRTWSRLAARGIWVNGSADGLGDLEPPDIDALAGRAAAWQRLTHRDTEDPSALATYVVDHDLPRDLEARTHFFWTSGSQFRRALEARPAIRDRWHASGPGRTSRVIRETLGSSPRISVWLEYRQWHRAVIS